MAEPNITPEIQQQVLQLQQASAQLQQAAGQRQQFEVMKSEAQQALEALQGAAEDAAVWRSVGSLMVQEGKAAAVERLKDDVETMDIRLKRLKTQEDTLRQQFETLQKKLQSVFGQ